MFQIREEDSWYSFITNMDPKTVAAVSLLVGFATFLTINRVIADPAFRPSINFKPIDLEALLFPKNREGQTIGFSKLLSQKNEEPVKDQSQKADTDKVVVESPTKQPVTGAPDKPTLITTPPPPAIQPPAPLPSQIEIPESLINSTVNSFIPVGTPITNLKVKLNNGYISVTGKILSPVAGDIVAEASILTVNKSVAVKIQKAKVGNLEIPSYLLASLETGANQTLNNILQTNYGTVTIKSVEVKEGKIVINF